MFDMFLFSGLVRLQHLFQEINKREMDLDIVVKQMVSVEHCKAMLKTVYNTETEEDLRIFLDLSMSQSQELIMKMVCSHSYRQNWNDNT